MRILTLAMMTAMLPLTACHSRSHGFGSDSTPGIKGSGSGTSRAFQAADFTSVNLRGSDDVEVRVGTAFSVRAEGPSADLDRLRIVREGDTLRIGRMHESGFHWSSEKVKIFVTLPRLVEASVAGSGDMNIDKVEGTSFSGNVAGSGNLVIGAVTVDQADLSVAGSGDMRVKGVAKQLSIDVAGSGDVDASGLKAQGAKVSIAGSGDVRADVTGPATVSVVGSGDVDLGAGARCSTSKMGSGEVRCGS